MADPDYGDGSAQSRQGAETSGFQTGFRNPSARTSTWIKSISPVERDGGRSAALKAILPQATVFTRERATEAALKQLHSPGILHVATHGFFLRDQEIRLIGSRDLTLDTVQSVGPSNQPIENPLLRSGLALAESISDWAAPIKGTTSPDGLGSGGAGFVGDEAGRALGLRHGSGRGEER